MPNIIKSTKSQFEQRLSATLKSRDAKEPLVRIRHSGDGSLLIEDFGLAIERQYHRLSARAKLGAMYNAVAVAAMKLRQHSDASRQELRILVDVAQLLDDMKCRSMNPLITYASKAGRRGKRRASHYIVEARRAMLAAAVARLKLTRENSFTSACQWVADRVSDGLKQHQLSLDAKMGGKWRRDTPEQKERRKQSPPTWGERVEGWADGLKSDAQYASRLQILHAYTAREDIENFCLGQLFWAIDRLICDTCSDPE